MGIKVLKVAFPRSKIHVAKMFDKKKFIIPTTVKIIVKK